MNEVNKYLVILKSVCLRLWFSCKKFKHRDPGIIYSARSRRGKSKQNARGVRSLLIYLLSINPIRIEERNREYKQRFNFLQNCSRRLIYSKSRKSRYGRGREGRGDVTKQLKFVRFSYLLSVISSPPRDHPHKLQNWPLDTLHRQPHINSTLRQICIYTRVWFFTLDLHND